MEPTEDRDPAQRDNPTPNRDTPAEPSVSPTGEPIPAENQAERSVSPTGELVAARAALADALVQVDALNAAVADAEANHQNALSAGAAQAAIAAEAVGQVSANLRRALLAENPNVIAELVQGDTAEALNASIETARAAYTRIAEAVASRTPVLPVVPAGASPRAEPEPETMSALQKITGALSRNGR